MPFIYALADSQFYAATAYDSSLVTSLRLPRLLEQRRSSPIVYHAT